TGAQPRPWRSFVYLRVVCGESCFGSRSVYFCPPLGFEPSNLSLSRNGLGYFGVGGSCGLGETFRAVTITINSVLLFDRFLLRNRLPRIGISPRPGILFMMLLTRLSMRPAITKLWPS